MARKRPPILVLIGGALALIGVAVLALFVLSVLKKGRPDPEWKAQQAALEQFVEAHEEQLIELERRLESLETMVAGDDWVPMDESTAAIEQDDPMLLWAHELRGEERPEFNNTISGRSSSDLNDIEPMLQWETDPSAIGGGFGRSDVPALESRLNRATAQYLLVAELEDVVMPEITHLDLGNKTGNAGEFSPGTTTFAVAVIDTQTMEIVACGRGEATNSEEVRPVDGPANDLWNRTGDAVREVARRIMGQSP